MTDPLAQYRKKPDGVVAQPPPPKGPDGYVAFDAKDRVARLKIRRASEDDPTRSPGYHYLLDVVGGLATIVVSMWVADRWQGWWTARQGRRALLPQAAGPPAS